MHTENLTFDQCLEILTQYKIAKTQHELNHLFMRELESENLLTEEIFTQLADEEEHYLDTMEILEAMYNVSV